MTSLPILNMIDLTRRSENLQRVKKGAKFDDLECEIITDKSLDEADLQVVEVEVNKKRKKKQIAEL